MENAELIGVSRQIALRNHMDVIANNLANINTSGYKGQKMVFEEYLMPVASANAFERRDQTLSYVHDYLSRGDMAQGAIIETGNPLDVAIEGEGWFVIETPEGERYSRDGSFKLSTEGELVTTSGFKVLGEGGAISFAPTDTGITIARDGTISTSEGERGKLRLVGFDGPDSFDPAGGNLYVPKEGFEAQPLEFVRVAQGAVEKSNVQPVVEITRMIEVTRAYQSVASMMKKQDELRTNAIGRLGRLDA